MTAHSVRCPKCGHALARGGLTTRQRRLFDFITEEVRNSGSPPSYERMRDHMGFATKSAVYRVIDCLEMRGYVARVRLPGRAGPGRPSSYKPAGRQSLMVLDVVP